MSYCNLDYIEDLEKKKGIKVSWVKLKADGHVDMENLEENMDDMWSSTQMAQRVLEEKQMV